METDLFEISFICQNPNLWKSIFFGGNQFLTSVSHVKTDFVIIGFFNSKQIFIKSTFGNGIDIRKIIFFMWNHFPSLGVHNKNWYS